MPEAPTGRGQPRDPGTGTPGNRGAPPRGVDVKPSPGGVRDQPGPGSRGPGGLWGPFRALGGLPRGTPGGLPGAPDLRNPQNGDFPDPDPSARGVLHQPLAPGPRGAFPGISPKWGKMPIFGQKGPKVGYSRQNAKKGHFCPFLAIFPHFGEIPGKVPRGPGARG